MTAPEAARGVRLVNGAVWTGRAERPWAAGLELRGGRVAALLGASREPAAGPAAARSGAGGRSAPELDLRGRAVLPGLVDAHVHLLPWARRRAWLDLRDAPDLAAVQRTLAAAAAALAPGEWLLAHGFHPASLGAARPHRAQLDAALPGRPVYIVTHDSHAAWASSEALRLAGVGRATADPPEGRLERDARGEPTGFLFESARELVTRHIPAPGAAREQELLEAGQREAHRLGVTSVHSFEGASEWRALQRLREAGRLTLRVVHMFPRAELPAYLEAGLRAGFGDERLRLGGLKLFADGTLGLRTAKMHQPYAAGGTGEWAVPPAELAELAGRAAAAGLGVAIHAIGDAAVGAALDALEAARRQGAVPLRVEHVQILARADLPRFAAAGIAASVQPVHFVTDRELAQAQWGERCALAYAWGPLAAAGAELVFGTDAPIEALDPWATLAAATAPGGPGTPAHHPARAVGLAQALEAMTRAPFRAMGLAGGELCPGAPADLVVLDRGARDLESGGERGTIRPQLTLVDGRAVHATGDFAGLAGELARA
ncbi:MAG TPA: amidohydrolase family protein [Candidatus Saccharimonadales bacterium]|nr:amidohydrolase family protein [Candidatus Saccharimonadales bacterium]